MNTNNVHVDKADKTGIKLLKIYMHISGFKGYLFTGKLVKTILLRAYPQIRHVFEPIKGSFPKLIHISPLFRTSRNGKIECIYSYAICSQKGKKFLIKCDGSPSIVEINGSYYFYMGFHESIVNTRNLLEALFDYRDFFDFMNKKLSVEIIEIDLHDPRIIGFEIARKALESGGFKLELSSPTMLRDPLRPVTKHKTVLPSPINVFATPVYAMLNAEGKYTRESLRRGLIRLHRLFHETYSVLGSVKIRWVYYSNKPEPALIGFVNYRIDKEYLKHLSRRLNIEEWLGEIFAYTLALGVGTGRATGFGHVELKPFRSQGMDS